MNLNRIPQDLLELFHLPMKPISKYKIRNYYQFSYFGAVLLEQFFCLAQVRNDQLDDFYLSEVIKDVHRNI